VARTYRFRDRWWVAHRPAVVRDLLVDLEHYPSWWPQVMAVAKIGEDDARVLCRSTLPYTLDLTLHAVSRELPTIEVSLGGHLRGHIRWTLVASERGTALDWEQEATVRGRLARLAAVASPLLRWNHARMMSGGYAGLRAALEAEDQ